MVKTAVVFDSAGTLLHMYRAAKDLRRGSIYYDIVTTDLAGTNPNFAIIILHIEPGQLMQMDGSYPVNRCIEELQVKIDIGCCRKSLSIDEAHSIISSDPLALVSDLQEVLEAVWDRCDDKRYLGVGLMVDVARSCIPYTLSTGGSLYPEVGDVASQLEALGVDTFIASGDKQEDVEMVSRSIGVKKEHTFGLSTPQRKCGIIRELKLSYEKVVMVGDAINDIMAFREADFAVLTVQQRNARPERLCLESDAVIDHITQIVPLVRDLL
ncbi:MAG: Cu+-exporting ATPase [Candidatus Methanocomedens sp.]|jgi:Cu+-exporting ATPase|nr:MAG: Cu+-exporting ATPase [ANME-2 cluster archaeon]MRG76506.1 HAD family hydrolase [ANME-2 cluster archaeon]